MVVNEYGGVKGMDGGSSQAKSMKRAFPPASGSKIAGSLEDVSAALHSTKRFESHVMVAYLQSPLTTVATQLTATICPWGHSIRPFSPISIS